MSPPSPNGSNGRDSQGRFAKGWDGGPGNPHAAQVAKLRAALLDAITPKDMREVAKALLARAKDGEIAAIRELINRTLGRPLEADLIARIEELEAIMGTQEKSR